MFTRLSLRPLVMVVAVLGCSGIAFAQSEPPPAGYEAGPQQRMQSGGSAGMGAHRRNRMRMAIRSLGLSPQQRSQIKTMMLGFHRSRLAGTPVPRRAMIAQIEGLLSPAQRARFETKMQRHGQGGSAGPDGSQSRGGMGGAQGPGYGNGPQGAGNDGGPQGPGSAPGV